MKNLFLLTLIFTVSSCYTTQIVVGEGAKGNQTIRLKQTHLINGLVSFEIPASTDWKKPYQFNPNLYIDISKELQYKTKALEAYHYEIRKPPHPRSKIITKAIANRWGSLSGYNAAEAFEIIMSRVSNVSKLNL